MSSQNDKHEQETQDETIERGFGTGLRAQLQRRRGQKEAPPPAVPAAQAEPPLVRVDLYANAPHQVNGAEPVAEVEMLRERLDEARKKERELRAAFAEQVEAYERKLSEEYDVSREQAKLDERNSK